MKYVISRNQALILVKIWKAEGVSFSDIRKAFRESVFINRGITDVRG